MSLIFGLSLIAIILVRALLRLAGFRLRPWLPPYGWNRFYADTLIFALILLSIGMSVGLPRTLGMTIVLAGVAAVIAGVLDSQRVRRAREMANAAAREPEA